MSDARLHAPATQRNRDVILEILREMLPKTGLILEVASGSGEHCVYFAAQLPGLTFQPSDPDPVKLASINAWVAASGTANVRPALALDAASPNWPIREAAGILCINMIHISPWAATQGLFAGAARILPAGAPIFLYGPYKQNGAHTAPSNAAFDADLRRENPQWGVRDLEEIAALGLAQGFAPPAISPMPSNNFALVFTRLTQSD